MGFLDNVRGALREVVSTRSSKQPQAPRDSGDPARESSAVDEAHAVGAQGVKSPRQRSETYTIEVGDTLDEISARSGTPVEDVVRMNDITDRDLIFPGQVIRVPVDSSGAPRRQGRGPSPVE